MRVAILCEYSGRAREAFRAKGHEVWSCDLEPSDDNSPWHFQGDVFEFLKTHGKFDLFICHPPCTFLANSGVRWLYNKDGTPNEERWTDMQLGAKFFLDLIDACFVNNDDAKIVVENPIMHKYAKALGIGQQTQVVQPWYFGDRAYKGTCLWIIGDLPQLTATNKLIPPRPGTPEHKEWSFIHNARPGKDRWKIRSRSFPGVVGAMADQWG